MANEIKKNPAATPSGGSSADTEIERGRSGIGDGGAPYDPVPIALTELLQTTGASRGELLRAGLRGELRLGLRATGMQAWDSAVGDAHEFPVPLDEFVLLHRSDLSELLVAEETGIHMVGIVRGGQVCWMQLESNHRVDAQRLLVPQDDWERWRSCHLPEAGGGSTAAQDASPVSDSGASAAPTTPLEDLGPVGRRRELVTLGLVIRTWAATSDAVVRGTFEKPNQSELIRCVQKQLAKSRNSARTESKLASDPEIPIRHGYGGSRLRDRLRLGLASTSPAQLEALLEGVMADSIRASAKEFPELPEPTESKEPTAEIAGEPSTLNVDEPTPSRDTAEESS